MKIMVGEVEARLFAVNGASESWPMDCELWAPDGVGPQLDSLPTMDCNQPSIMKGFNSRPRGDARRL